MNGKTKRIMIDLETVDVRPTSAILSIGAVEFIPEGNVVWKPFYHVVNMETDDQLENGATASMSTLKFWFGQPDPARGEFTRVQGPGTIRSIEGILLEFAAYVRGIRGEPDNKVEVWANGMDFDNTVLSGAYERYDIPRPWKYNEGRDFRTLRDLGIKLEEEVVIPVGTAHNALDDAVKQAHYAVAFLRKLGIS